MHQECAFFTVLVSLYLDFPSRFGYILFVNQFAPFRDSSMVEHAAVNRRVVGSSPTRGAKSDPKRLFGVWRFIMAVIPPMAGLAEQQDRLPQGSVLYFWGALLYSFYILHLEPFDRYYIGSSSNPERRLSYHNTY